MAHTEHVLSAPKDHVEPQKLYKLKAMREHLHTISTAALEKEFL